MAKMQSKLWTLPTSVTATVPAPTTHKETLSLNAQVRYLIRLEFFLGNGEGNDSVNKKKYGSLGWIGLGKDR